MAFQKPESEDVFAGFHINSVVRDNEESLEKHEEEELVASSEFVDDSVFAEFHLDEIVRKHEERLRKEDLEKKGVADDDDDEDISIRGESLSFRSIGQFLRGESLSWDSSLGRILSKHSDNNPRHLSNRGETGNAKDEPIASGNDRSEHGIRHLPHKKRKHTTTSRSGTTITATVPEDEEYYNNSDDDESIIAMGGGDVEEGENDDDDDDSYVGPNKMTRDDVITRSRTGMPIGGMVSASDICEENTCVVSDYHWVSPHAADTIFSDFDIDEIVKDYEKLHRKINFGANMGRKLDSDEIEEEENNEQILGIRIRYRTLVNLWLENFPRTNAIIFDVVLPLLLIIAVTVVLGIFLAEFEIDNEIKSNDEIVRAQFELLEYPYQNDLSLLLVLPSICLHYFVDQKNQKPKPFNISSSQATISNIASDMAIDTIINNTDNTSAALDVKMAISTHINETIISQIIELAGHNFPPVTPGFDSNQSFTIHQMQSYVDVCSAAASKILNTIPPTERAEVAQSLSFNWMRCWNTTELGDVNPFYANNSQVEAATHQEEFYYKSWKRNQTSLYNRYMLDQNCTNGASCQQEIYELSVRDATGSTMCAINKGASAWFWFVFLTTVGYGNAAPETINGKLFVGLLGWITVIAWAFILYIAGKVVGIIIDDIFRKFRLRFMTGNVQSAIVWGIIALGTIALVAETYYNWESRTANPYTYKFTLFGIGLEHDTTDLSRGDAYWFSYISLLTVGLGDFFLASETIFMYDFFIWTSLLLTGFTFLSTFLGQIAEMMAFLMPGSDNSLKDRLRNTKLVGKREVHYKKENEKGIEKLEKLVEIMDDDDLDLLAERVTRIRVKKNLLVHLLNQTRIELEHYKQRGERYENLSYARVCQEENMLNDVTENTRKEREKLEMYRDGRAHAANGTPLPPPGGKQSYFDDGTPLDLVGNKLKLRQGNKSARKKIKASWYI